MPTYKDKLDFSGFESYLTIKYELKDVKIKKIIFHDPATIIYWSDGTKTVVKADEQDEYNKIDGLNFCIAKKFLSSKEYHHYVELMDMMADDALYELIDSYESLED